MLKRAKELIDRANTVLIGAGAGLSAAAGLRYSGPKFEHDFADFIRRYGITDLYTSSFYPFRTEEERWACWARHIRTIRYEPEALPLYRKLLELVSGKDYFVITTNVDGQFRKAGFCPERLFEVQGDYGLNQCRHGCHDTLYPNESLVRHMVDATRNCRIPSRLVPVCPRCGGPMEVHVRKDEYFVQDAAWHASHERYLHFVRSFGGRKSVVLLELGVGFNTPTIIRYPFELMAESYKNVTLIRINKSETAPLFGNAGRRLLLLPEDADAFISSPATVG